MINLNKQRKEAIKHYAGLTLLIVFNLLDFILGIIGGIIFGLYLAGYVTIH